MKGIIVIKIVIEIKFKGVWGELESRFPEAISHKIFETNCSFYM